MTAVPFGISLPLGTQASPSVGAGLVLATNGKVKAAPLTRVPWHTSVALAAPAPLVLAPPAPEGGTKTTAETRAASGAVPMTAVPFGISLPLGTQASPSVGAGLVLATNGKVKAAPLTRVPWHTSVALAAPAPLVLAPPAPEGGTKTTAETRAASGAVPMTAVPFGISLPLGTQASPSVGAGLVLATNGKVKAAPLTRVPWHTSVAPADPAPLVLAPPAPEGGTKTTAETRAAFGAVPMTAVPFGISLPLGTQASPSVGAGLVLATNGKVKAAPLTRVPWHTSVALAAPAPLVLAPPAPEGGTKTTAETRAASGAVPMTAVPFGISLPLGTQASPSVGAGLVLATNGKVKAAPLTRVPWHTSVAPADPAPLVLAPPAPEGGTKTTAETRAAFGAVPMTAVPFGISLPLGTQASPSVGAGLVLATNGKVKAAPLTRVPWHTSVALAAPAPLVLAPPAPEGGTKTTAETRAASGAVPMTAVPFGISLPLGTQASPSVGAGLVLATNGKVKAAPLTRVPWHTSVAPADPAPLVLAPPAPEGGTKTTAETRAAFGAVPMTAVPFGISLPLGTQASPSVGAGLVLATNGKVKAAPLTRVPWHTSVAPADPAPLVLAPPAPEGGTKTTAETRAAFGAVPMTAVPFGISLPLGTQASPSVGAGLVLATNGKVKAAPLTRVPWHTSVAPADPAPLVLAPPAPEGGTKTTAETRAAFGAVPMTAVPFGISLPLGTQATPGVGAGLV